MTPSNRPIPGQSSLSGVKESASIERDFNARNVFSEVATPEYWNLDPEKYSDITPQMIDLAAPNNLRSSLIGVKRGGSEKLVTGYTPENSQHEVYVALFPLEHRLLSGTLSPRKYGERALADTLAGKLSLIADIDRRNYESETKQLKSVGEKLASMQNYLEVNLRPEQTRLLRLSEAAVHPGLQRRKASDTRIDIATLLDWTLPQVIQTIGRQRGWNNSQHDLARRAIDVRLFFIREQNQHLQNWRDLIGLLADYNQVKIELFADRIGRFKGYLAQHGQDER